MGGDVKLSAVSVIHGSLSIQVVTQYASVGESITSVPLGGQSGGPGAPGGNRGADATVVQPVVVPEQSLTTNDGPAQSMRLDEGANVDELVKGLHAIGTTAHDVVAILQAIRAAGGMQADLEVQ
jgi:flagellar P-ring protein precursor FlgI